MKMKQKGVSTAAATITVVVTAAVVVAAAAVFLLGGPKAQPTGGIGFPMNATATVRLHDAEVIDLSDYEEYITPYLPSGITINISGTVTVNSFSATNVTAKLHNKTANEWITIIEGQTITDMIENNDFVNQISSGTYDKVSVYLGTITFDVSWSNVAVTGTVDLSSFGGTGTWPINYTQPDGSYSGSIAINQTFEIPLSPEVEVIEGENQVFDVDTSAPLDIDFSGTGQDLGFGFQMGENCSLDAANMSARGL